MHCLLLISLLLSSLLASAQEGSVCRSGPEPLVAYVGQRSWALYAGNSAQLDFVFEIDPRYHIQADSPADPNLIPTRLHLYGPSYLTVGKVLYPKPGLFTLEGSNAALLVFEGRFSVSVPVSVSGNVPDGNYRLQGELHYQACDDRRCLFPRILEFEVDFSISRDRKARIRHWAFPGE